jgi:hypothetical protein
MFHCVVWIGYSFLTDVQLRTVDVPLCGVNRVFLIDRCSTYNCWCSIVWCGYGIPSSQMFNLELLMFHCVVWIRYSFLTDIQLRTVDVPLCGVNRVFLIDRCSTYNCWYCIVWCGYGIPSWQMFNLELLIFHCVMWIGYYFFTVVQLRTFDIPLCGVDRVLLLDRCST